jgi:pantothenate synthetase
MTESLTDVLNCGMALSMCLLSRNARLSDESRTKALSISQAIKWAEEAKAAGQLKDPAAVAEEVKRRITESGGTVDYVEVSAA